MHNRIAASRKAEILHTKLSDPEVALFLYYFLQPQLELLAQINKQLRKANQNTMYMTYGKINAFFFRSFVHPILILMVLET